VRSILGDVYSADGDSKRAFEQYNQALSIEFLPHIWSRTKTYAMPNLDRRSSILKACFKDWRSTVEA